MLRRVPRARSRARRRPPAPKPRRPPSEAGSESWQHRGETMAERHPRGRARRRRVEPRIVTGGGWAVEPPRAGRCSAEHLVRERHDGLDYALDGDGDGRCGAGDPLGERGDRLSRRLERLVAGGLRCIDDRGRNLTHGIEQRGSGRGGARDDPSGTSSRGLNLATPGKGHTQTRDSKIPVRGNVSRDVGG